MSCILQGIESPFCSASWSFMANDVMTMGAEPGLEMVAEGVAVTVVGLVAVVEGVDMVLDEVEAAGEAEHEVVRLIFYFGIGSLL